MQNAEKRKYSVALHLTFRGPNHSLGALWLTQQTSAFPLPQPHRCILPQSQEHCCMLHAACSNHSTNLGLQVIACDFPKGCLHFPQNYHHASISFTPDQCQLHLCSLHILLWRRGFYVLGPCQPCCSGYYIPPGVSSQWELVPGERLDKDWLRDRYRLFKMEEIIQPSSGWHWSFRICLDFSFMLLHHHHWTSHFFFFLQFFDPWYMKFWLNSAATGTSHWTAPFCSFESCLMDLIPSLITPSSAFDISRSKSGFRVWGYLFLITWSDFSGQPYWISSRSIFHMCSESISVTSSWLL